MAFNYAALQATATRLLASFGQAATLVRTERAEYDPNNASADAGETVRCACKAVTDRYSLAMIDGTLIRLGDLRAFVSVESLTFEPKPGDKLILGVPYTILNPVAINPGGTILLYDLQVRRA